VEGEKRKMRFVGEKRLRKDVERPSTMKKEVGRKERKSTFWKRKFGKREKGVKHGQLFAFNESGATTNMRHTRERRKM